MALCSTKKFLELSKVVHRQVAHKGMWSDVEMAPPDPIFGISVAYNKDKSDKKVNVGVGAYRNDEGKPHVLPVVRIAEERIAEKKMNHEYAPLSGNPDFCKLSAELAFGEDHPVITDARYSTAQTLGGTGALRVGAAFHSQFQENKCIFMPDPTWGNHLAVFRACGMNIERYRYYNPKKLVFDFDACMEDLCGMPKKTAVLMHACAHNPTGIDPTCEQWDEMSAIAKKRELIVHMDLAYQGFASGDFERDAYALRKFAEDGNEIILCQSFSKNMGLYGQRVGALTVVSDSKETAAKIKSQLQIIIRCMYSNPPLHGARIVTEILCDDELRSQWFEQVKEMADRIIDVRKQLRETLEKSGSDKKWEHITQQIGMFCYTGLKKDQVEKLTKEHHIYMTKDGRISMAGVTSGNVGYIGESMQKVIGG